MRNTKQQKFIKLQPNQAIVLSERQFKQTNFNTQLYYHSENSFYASIPLLKTALPFAEIRVITVEPDRIFASIESETKPIIQALKNNRAFRKLLKKGSYPCWELLWKYSFSIDEYEEIKRIKYPLFYVILNNSKQTITI